MKGDLNLWLAENDMRIFFRTAGSGMVCGHVTGVFHLARHLARLIPSLCIRRVRNPVHCSDILALHSRGHPFDVHSLGLASWDTARPALG
jgi:hypothetical protein